MRRPNRSNTLRRTSTQLRIDTGSDDNDDDAPPPGPLERSAADRHLRSRSSDMGGKAGGGSRTGSPRSPGSGRVEQLESSRPEDDRAGSPAAERPEGEEGEGSARSSQQEQYRSELHRFVCHLVKSDSFNRLTVGVIVFNTVSIGAETFRALKMSGSFAVVFGALDLTFVTYYTAELALKIYSYPRSFWFSKYNQFDVFVLATSYVQLAQDIFGVSRERHARAHAHAHAQPASQPASQRPHHPASRRVASTTGQSATAHHHASRFSILTEVHRCGCSLH